VCGSISFDLLGVEVERPADQEQVLAEVRRPLALADLGECRDEPERADREGALDAVETVVGLLDPVAEDQPHVGQIIGDREHGLDDAFIVGGEEADERDQQRRGIELIGAVVLAEDPVGAHPLGEDVRLDPIRLGAPALHQLALAARLRQAGAAVERHPAHQLR